MIFAKIKGKINMTKAIKKFIIKNIIYVLLFSFLAYLHYKRSGDMWFIYITIVVFIILIPTSYFIEKRKKRL